ncbi:HD domain-containing protein [Desulfurispira natronophila]|uniref:Putative HD superfamily hydrolase involved in NAD metabolism n=1 Tax=Desulfurispira natronophila TaxID=682562 RepID=A0A7W7Y3I7_9BACT|nr:HD domain-containing protein [Desulfurispira natronophila]MBB5021415.1 putative HD superfamily hydrolase involved in NAD metabolism [Desulfurispira natronophila]
MGTSIDIRGELYRYYDGEPQRLREHVQRVCTLALELGKSHDLPEVEVETAALGHDLFRARSNDFLCRQASHYGIKRSDWDAAPILYHGPLAAAYLYHEHGYTQADVLLAIACHTNLSRNSAMNPVAQVLFIADKIEPGKPKGYNDEIIQLAKRCLSKAAAELIRYIIAHIQQNESYKVPQDLREALEVLILRSSAENNWQPAKSRCFMT